jgi:hypothetical protein
MNCSSARWTAFALSEPMRRYLEAEMSGPFAVRYLSLVTMTAAFPHRPFE